jgi:ABC-type uncharacterized transport system permease subunit
MQIFISFLEIILPILYFITIWAYAKSFFGGEKIADALKTPLLHCTVIVHSSYIVSRTMEYHHPPITSMFEILSLIAFTVCLSYLIIEIRTQNRTTGYFILIFPFFFQLVSSLFIKERLEIPTILQSNLLGFHVSSALLGYAAITISAVYGFLYLMLHHEIKSNRFGVIYKRLPNLEMLERMSFTATVLGFIFLTIAIIVGLIWLPRAFTDFDYTDPKLLGTLAVWFIYLIGFSAKQLAGWQGKRIIMFSMAGFVAAIFSMTVINMFFSGFHKFY